MEDEYLKFVGRVCKEGHSLKVYVPAPSAQHLGIKENDFVELRVKKVHAVKPRGKKK